MSTQRLKLEKKVFIKGKIVIKTGIHIGGSSLGLQIGGANNVVIRNPITNLPYIPGSSLKGKMRSLLEKSHGLVKIESVVKDNKTVWVGKLCDNPKEDIVQLFGRPADAEGTEESFYAPTRLMVRDGDLINVKELAEAENTDMYCTEIKTEVNLDRLTSAATPRNFERVPAGAEFSLEIVIDIYNVDSEGEGEGEGEERKNSAKNYIELIKQALTLIEDDYLGGHGTRGYGQVKFQIKSVMEKTAETYRNGAQAETSGFHDTFADFFAQEPVEVPDAV